MKLQAEGTPRSRGRRAGIGLLTATATLGLLAVLWQSGFLGTRARRFLLPMLFSLIPATRGMEWVQMAETEPPAVPARGLQITLCPEYLTRVLHASPFPAWLIPPGLLDPHTVIFARWKPSGHKAAQALPLILHLSHTAAQRPKIVFRLSAVELNTLLIDEFAEDWSDTGEYIFGHYDLNQRIWIHTLSVSSAPPPRDAPSDPVRFTALATGRLRYWFKDGPVSARITANVTALAVTVAFVPVRHSDGIGLDFSARVDDLVISVDNMAPWLERRLAARIRRSIEQSLNRRRRKERMAKHRLPDWLPLDADVDLVIHEADPR